MKKLFTLLLIPLTLAACNGTPIISPTSSTSPSMPPSTAPSPSIVATVIPATTTMVQIALVNEIGTPSTTTFGCGDEIQMVNRSVSTTTPLNTAINELLSVHTRNYGLSGLTSALYQNNFTLTGVSISGNHATINLTGSTSQDGACDAPRIQEQMKRTILQFPTITSFTILLNGSAANWTSLFSGA